MTANRPLRWDIFCQVIDNFGDVGVCWRAAAELAARGEQVRLWLDDASALAWMAPAPHPAGLNVHAWPGQPALLPADGAGDVVIEAFGCTLPEPFLALIAQRHARQALGGAQSPVWINLEYLSAEAYVERCHRLPSRLMSGPAAGLTRWFFYPGFTPRTGGLLREAAFDQRQSAFDREAWRTARGIDSSTRLVSLFCYEPPALPQLLAQLQSGDPSHLLVTPGRATEAVRAALPPSAPLPITWLAPCAQPAFDEMLWASDLNLVRGEDSLVRALWAGEAFVWQIYPQHDNAHHAKLEAFLDWLEAPPSLRLFHHHWNGMPTHGSLPVLTAQMLADWRDCARSARARGWVVADLISQLQQFVAEKS
ncbi:elongation factor P maturation arginine rhamnosyltransferase EarP [Comamonas endophytica]|uniref:Protein-arginine rhamnosyltransferase n=1 Tax=Comamonas endophytica TaxID=2949090 RepID=A0ABY6GC65_9BURK|nr:MULTISPECIES: elongation factor P maturation arginine rhamnosyltransferase EarP [unclassified Acidovorax]MCD2512180.1 elongation factor P maturation arginine rhamnosyltransferase EarP [Acidovorax sp. D4N7]UYG51952.1 elongation factor P maturation arginine rhamnosyltransferase EarP [Acidovorax sp. 5MLIR]